MAAVAAMLAACVMSSIASSPAGAEAPRAAPAPLRIVALGDSLTAGFGLPQPDAFPVVLQKALAAKGHNVTIANAGVSGDTSSGGLERLDWSVPDGTQAVILELGANDMLRGVDPAVTRAALDGITAKLKARGIAVLLAGMRAAPNLGGPYAAEFESIYTDLAKRYQLTLYPFFLDGVAGRHDLVLPDGLHPSAEGVRVIVERMLPTVETFLKSVPQQG